MSPNPAPSQSPPPAPSPASPSPAEKKPKAKIEDPVVGAACVYIDPSGNALPAMIGRWFESQEGLGVLCDLVAFPLNASYTTPVLKVPHVATIEEEMKRHCWRYPR